MGTRRTSLPGVGTQYDFTTESGRRLSVVVHQDGRRFLGFYAADDPDASVASVPLSPDEAAALAHLIHPDAIDAVRTDGIDLVTERIPVSARSPYAGRRLGETRARTRTGASIVAVLRRTSAHPSPGPDFRFAIGDTLVAVGTREGVDGLAGIISGTGPETDVDNAEADGDGSGSGSGSGDAGG
ncbi:cation:proton antiporter regulatory subunit [Streptomyces formicae]|uniref:Cation:proton antiporter regulatory subunit n=1 Tax=Streptomyces formicae TaxID=1616117 RepID=A0ABY3WFP7_9ACTN|nr:cation:proton antiporter regulatory subunit [Streptomyces formicae]